MTRIYQAIQLQSNTCIQLDEKASHYLAHVLRVKVGETLSVFNGLGGEYRACVKKIAKKTVALAVGEFEPREAESPVTIHLAQGLAKGEKMDFIIQKAVELGVKTITPLVTQRSNVRLNHERIDKKIEHWESVIVSACEQSGRNRIPHLTAPISYPEWLPQVKADKAFVLTPHGGHKLGGEFGARHRFEGSIVLLIGPEGGLNQDEIELAIAAGFKPINLGPRILRTETATLAAITAVQYQFGDLG